MFFFKRKHQIEVICFEEALRASEVILQTSNFNMLHFLGFQALKNLLDCTTTLSNDDITYLRKNVAQIAKRIDQLMQENKTHSPKTILEKDIHFLEQIKGEYIDDMFILDQIKYKKIKENINKKKYFYFYEKIPLLQYFLKKSINIKKIKVQKIKRLIQSLES